MSYSFAKSFIAESAVNPPAARAIALAAMSARDGKFLLLELTVLYSADGTARAMEELSTEVFRIGIGPSERDFDLEQVDEETAEQWATNLALEHARDVLYTERQKPAIEGDSRVPFKSIEWSTDHRAGAKLLSLLTLGMNDGIVRAIQDRTKIPQFREQLVSVRNMKPGAMRLRDEKVD